MTDELLNELQLHRGKITSLKLTTGYMGRVGIDKIDVKNQTFSFFMATGLEEREKVKDDEAKIELIRQNPLYYKTTPFATLISLR